MKVAVLTLTRDRLAYTQHCFQTLWDYAGCPFDWYVLDQASVDGTREWLDEQDLNVHYLQENIGVCPGLNVLLDHMFTADYDVIVRFDNDCEVLQPGTLEAVSRVAAEYGLITAPHVAGLNNPPPTIATISLEEGTVSETTILGGIFMAIPAELFEDYRFDESFNPWEGDEAITTWYRGRGGACGYLDGWTVNHYLTTRGQWSDIPAYFARTQAEGKVAL